MNFKPLNFQFRKSGFLLELIKRDGLVCLVKRSRIGFPYIPPHYEVVKLRQNPAWTTPTGIHMPPSETYPSSQTWGTYGFTYKSLDKPEHGSWTALSRYNTLVSWTCNQSEPFPDDSAPQQAA
jgi:hypothetical protein